MTTIRLKGPGLNNYFAEYMVKEHGPDGARERCSGKMLVAVEHVIAEQARKEQDEAKAQGFANWGGLD